ncbi:MAG: hypothetical protein ACTHOR_01810 [Devosia sp.]
MPKSSEIEGLIARLEAASRRTPEIEAAIYNALVGPEDGNRIAFKVKDWSKLPGSRLSPFHDGWLVGKSETDEYADNMPAYTASIDASLALVERLLPRWGATVVTDPPSCCLRISTSDSMARFKATGYFLDEFPIYEASTPPLAILIALLHALSAKAAP